MAFRQTAIHCSIWTFVVVGLGAVANVSSADPITVRFTVFPDPADPVNLAPLNSSFTFDSSLIPVDAGFVEDRTGQLATDIGPFTWGTTVWNTANASVWFLRFDAMHGLREFVLGGAPGGFDGGMFGVDDFDFRVPFSSYTLGAVPEQRSFLARTTSPDLVPEPGTLMLLPSGIAALAARRRSLRSFARSARSQARERG